MNLRIIKNGLLDTIQDAGRYGYQCLGINPGGAMDTIAMRVANMLVGNDPSEAIIEMHSPAADIEFEETALIALAGADFSASVNGKKIPVLHPVLVQKGTILQFGKKESGARTYLAIAGGVVADNWLQSKSTNTKVKCGGFKGRALQKNDRIVLKKKSNHVFTSVMETVHVFPWYAKVSELYVTNTIRFIPGNEYWLLQEASRDAIEKNSFSITRENDRMGYRLTGNALEWEREKEMISTAVTRGTIQLVPDGQLIILMADHQTTGGYPRVGHVISADISSLAQLQAGDRFFLKHSTLAQAEEAFLIQEMNLQQLQNACNFRLQEYFKEKE